MTGEPTAVVTSVIEALDAIKGQRLIYGRNHSQDRSDEFVYQTIGDTPTVVVDMEVARQIISAGYVERARGGIGSYRLSASGRDYLSSGGS